MNKKFKRSLTILLSSVLVASSVILPTDAAEKKVKEKNYAEGEVIAVLNDNAASQFQSKKKAAAVYGKGIKLKASYTFSANKGNKLKIAALKSSTLSTEKLIKKLKSNSSVKYAFPNYIKKASAVTNDTYSKYLWGLKNEGQNNGTKDLDTKAPALWDKAAESKDEPVVAIIDTGIDADHEDLKSVLWENPYGSKLFGKHGYDFTGYVEDSEPVDDNGHGTHCAGIIAGVGDNRKGICGINKTGVKIMALKFLDAEGSGFDEAGLACFDYISRAKKLGANVAAINCSWGGSGDEDEKRMYDELFDELGKQGIVTCVAAGNENTNLDEQEFEDSDDFFGFGCDVPASSDSRYCITVAASNGNDELASFSNYGESKADIAAPGTEILSSVSYYCFNPTVYNEKEIKKICAYLQKYDGEIKEGEFGYPNRIDPSTLDELDIDSAEFSVDSSDNFFGTEGKSLMITPKIAEEDEEDEGYEDEDYEDEDDEDDDYYDDEDSWNDYVYFEIPYKLDYDGDHRVSFMYSSDSMTEGEVYDVDASTSYDEIFNNDFDDDYIIYLSKGQKKSASYSTDFYCDGGYWSHVNIDSFDSYEDEDYEDYKKSKAKDADDDDEYYDDDEDYEEDEDNGDRKLVFKIRTDGAPVYIDDISVSKPDVADYHFGKYDFYNGTSMATPYVTGAIALAKRANPDSEAEDLINMVRNTGREKTDLAGKVNTASVLSLDRTNQTPPYIANFDYNEDGKVEVRGSFRDITKVIVDGENVTPEASGKNSIILPDNNYNTYKINIGVNNANGRDNFEKLLSDKKSYNLATDEIGAPEDTSSGLLVNADNVAYFIAPDNSVGELSYDGDKKSYVYSKDAFKLKFNSILGDDVSPVVQSAVYKNGKIYMSVLGEVKSKNTQVVFGYESAFVSFDIESGELKSYGELPDECLLGSSAAVYNDDVYLLGGMNYDKTKLTDSVYKADGDKLTKTSYKLPEQRAYTKFIQYGDKLVGVYGTLENEFEKPEPKDDEEIDEDEIDEDAKGKVINKIPSIILFDGKSWTKSSVKLKSDDYEELSDVSSCYYYGNLGLDKDGIICNGAYFYGLGDTFTYNPDTDKAVSNDCSFNNEVGGNRLIGTSVPGAFVGFNIVPIEEEDDFFWFFSASASKNSFLANDVTSDEINTFTISLDNGEPKPKTDSAADTATEPNADKPTEATQATQATAAKPVSKTVKPAVKAKAKKTNPIKVKAKSKAIKAAKLAAKNTKLKLLTVKNAKGKLSYKLMKKGTSKKLYKSIKLNKKGVLILKKAAYAKKTYKVRIRVTAAGNKAYNAKKLTKTVKIKIK
jgi:subtilisin family serine protease